MNFMPQEIAAAVTNDKLEIEWLDKRAEKMLSDKHFWNKITSQGNPIINLKNEMQIWINRKKFQNQLVNTKPTH